MNIIFVCGGFFPDTSATGNCVKQIADKFSQHGVNVYIVCKSGISYPKEEMLNGQHVFRITNKRLSEWYRISDKKKTWRSQFELFLYKSFWAVYGLLMPDGLDHSLVKQYVNQIRKITDSDDINAVIPCCMPAECLKAAYICAEEKGISFFPLLYDLYSGNKEFFRFKWNQILRSNRAIRLESKMFSASKRIFYVDNWKEYFQVHAYKNAIRVEHPLLVYRTPNPGELRNKNKINAIYQGEVNRQMRPPTAMLKAFEYIVQSHGSISLHVCAYGNSAYEAEELSKKLPDQVIFYGRVGKDVADRLYDASDVAVIIANRNPEIVPSKIFECIASGFPIVYFYYTKKEKSYSLLTKYSLVNFVPQGEDSTECYEKLAEWIQQNYKKRLNYEDVSAVYKDAKPDYVFSEIKKLLGEDQK